MTLPHFATTSLLAAACSFVLTSMVSCGPEPVGVTDCQRIEQARCEAAAGCGVDDVEGCKRFYRDQCLHGLAIDASPGTPAVDACVAAIQAVGACTASDPEAKLKDCPDGAPAEGIANDPDETPLTSCNAVLNPQRIVECSFLSPPVETTDDSSDDDDSSSGGAGGSN